MAVAEPRLVPIIYVRGFAMTQNEIDETSFDPFNGFNIGSTTLRARPNKTDKPRKQIFESPMVRLASDYGYADAFEDGYDILDPEWEVGADGTPTGNRLSNACVIVFRYYDVAATAFGGQSTPSIQDSARDLSALVAQVRELVCANPANNMQPADFRCYLVAHSMGGLICRAFLQNPALDPMGTHDCVSRLFTYATPHNGIEIASTNVPSWLTPFKVANFNRQTMADYLDLKTAFGATGRVDLIPESRFPSRNVFCMVGTNRLDYEVAAGLSRTFVGHGSDGLVRIENATLCALNNDGTIGTQCAKAFAYRSHSGPYGIVNSEEAYQNLVRFLFGDVRIDIWMDISEIRLPEKLSTPAMAGKVDALYQIELNASPRGKFWYLTRRKAEEDSVACVRHRTWQEEPRQYLSSVFLSRKARVNPKRPSLAYAMSVGVRVPDYEVDGILWTKEHYEGGYLFQNALVLEITPPPAAGGSWRAKYAWQGNGIREADVNLPLQQSPNGEIVATIDFDSTGQGDAQAPQPTSPGIRGTMRFVVSSWNV
ncbi:hypothetical protein [uncultured Pseudacidovorax sp.]|uniref:esterase/lipase family protein n=1 Tax=uncultured Pseudacidovorax sp. TaxID=679313 RepID=UPI0025E15AB6|nr:hypothetical protein [uncultured Pseudacidovorax sp.]